MAEVFLEHVYKVYEGKVEAVRDFCLDIKDREFMVFVVPPAAVNQPPCV